MQIAKPILDFPPAVVRSADERAGLRRCMARAFAVLGLILASTSEPVALAQPAGLSQWMQMPGMQNGGVFQVPTTRPVSRKTGLQLSIDTRWTNNYGYRPIHVTVTSLKPTTVDHLITIKLKTGWWSSQRGSVTVEQDFELLTGSTTATTTIACPQYQLATQYFAWEVWVDGIKDKDLSIDDQNSANTLTGVAMGGGQGLSMVAVGPVNRQRWLTSPNVEEFSTLLLPVADFPKRWLDYTCLDVAMLSRSELQSIAKLNPEALVALGRWIHTGGQLWVTDAGTEWEQLSDIAEIFGLSEEMVDAAEDEDEETEKVMAAPVLAAGAGAAANALDAEDEQLDDTPATVGWRPVRFSRRGRADRVVTFLDLRTNMTRVARDPQTIAQLESDPNFVSTNQQFGPDSEEGQEGGTRRRWPADSSRWFVEQPLGMGVVRAFRDDAASLERSTIRNAAKPGPDAADPWTRRRVSALSMALRSSRDWDSRHGMKPDEANHDFPKLLVPGVGLAPVWEFEILITLFVLLIGPVNYLVLKRFGRLHLLVLTVPLAAALMTTTLFAYAILSDGFGTTVRAQSFTTLDQRTGEAACWSRLSYYSGMAPSQGLTMPDDVAVYPIIPGWNESSIDASIGAEREMMWAPPDAKLVRGWLRSRTPTQFLTVRARKSPYVLDLTPAKGKLNVANELGTAINFVVATDGAGNLYAAESLPADASGSLQPIKRVDAIRRVRQLVTENEPQAPPALAAEDSDFALMQQRQSQRMMSRQYGLQYSDERLSGNLLHDALASLAGLAGQPALQLPPKSYVAFTQSGPEVALGMSSAREDASFHVILGKW